MISAADQINQSAQVLMARVPEESINTVNQLPCREPNVALWFFYGFIIALILYLILQLIVSRKNATLR
jgi:hypothetical protein